MVGGCQQETTTSVNAEKGSRTVTVTLLPLSTSLYRSNRNMYKQTNTTTTFHTIKEQASTLKGVQAKSKRLDTVTFKTLATKRQWSKERIDKSTTSATDIVLLCRYKQGPAKAACTNNTTRLL